MADAENGTRYKDLLCLLRQFAQCCAWAAIALDAEADAVAFSTAVRLRGEAEAAWQAAGQARAAAEAAAHQFSLHDELPLNVAAVYGAVLDLPATDAHLANALVRFEAMIELGGGGASPDNAGLAGPMLAPHGGATPAAAAAFARAFVARSQDPPTPEELASLHAEAVVVLHHEEQPADASAEQHAEALRLAALAVELTRARRERDNRRPAPVPPPQSTGLGMLDVAHRESLSQHRPERGVAESQEQ
ncbi:hypothetical protein [Streptomyces chartreusis]|uniref:Uncharacterized protein n=1 Tax=Streptomyces chartreusis TaxID=1969 RepID=A0A7H8T5N7_STRCX|nr:hypothetical protein [Streptomyces chartreusis]QKZ18829.1 hypothetical protein HUT05_16540 [Streptomyces chartreusis]